MPTTEPSTPSAWMVMSFSPSHLSEEPKRFMGLTPGVLQTPCLQSPVGWSRKRREDPMRWTWMHTIEESNRTFKSDAFLLEGEDSPEELFATRFTKSVKKFC
ncbi:hypothetical protein CPC08DRAFT_762981 [Agrocybe pediades]|nr:hypothetical protein CPC08DRAFT_762981 [Agrocybe pediades]